MNYKTKPFAHQLEAYKFTEAKPNFALFMEQGTGKTKTAIDIAATRFTEGKINGLLIVAPNHVHRQWAVEQLPIHCPVAYRSFVFKSGMGKTLRKEFSDFIVNNNEPLLKVLCVNIDAFSFPSYLTEIKQFVTNHKTMIILDEATCIKNPDSKRFKNLVYGLSNVKYRGKAVVASSPLSLYRCILTGTPVTNSPLDAWAMFEFLEHDYFNRGYYAFKANYVMQQKLQIYQGNVLRTIQTPIKDLQKIRAILKQEHGDLRVRCEYGISDLDILYIKQHPEMTTPYKYLGELKAQMQKVAFFKRANECFDLPPKIYKTVIVPMNKEQKAAYEQLENEFLTEYEGKSLTVLNKITLYTRLSQLAGGFLPFTDEDTNVTTVTQIGTENVKAEMLANEMEEGDFPCIIVTRFTAEAEYLYNYLSSRFKEKRVGLFIGPHKVPASPIESFKNGELDILIANERMISKGHNLQLSHTIYFYSVSYSLEDRDQTEDRICRYGQTEKCIITDFVTENSIDMKVYAALREKKNLLDYFRNTTIKEDLCTVDKTLEKYFPIFIKNDVR